MSFDVITIIPLVSIGLVLRKVVIRGEQIKRIKERSDQIIGMICGEGIIQISDMTID